MRDVKAHYIKSNEVARIPSRFIILDTEAVRTKDKNGETQSWALAVATFLVWKKDGTIDQVTSRFNTPMELWQAVSSFTRTGRRTVLYAHNLNYDLRISQALTILPALGWMTQDIRLDGRGSWSKWSREKASLVLSDSASIFPVKLEYLATILGMKKLTLPQSCEREKLFQRCTTDVEILTCAITLYVKWLRTGVCGNWQMTGASQAWSHWRHSHYTHKVLVHDNEEALKAERSAMHAGRCEAWRWGKYDKDVWYEYDWQNSYPRIARDSLLPSRLCGTVTTPNPKSLAGLLKKYCVLAELEVTTDIPCVPSVHNGRVLWPTGTFTTTLWDPEIRLLLGNGATFCVRKAWLYKRDPILKDWAEWILSSLHDKTDRIEPWQKLILKHWSRALIGRFGMRYKTWESFATATDSRVYISQMTDLDDGSEKELMQIGTQVFTSGDLKEIRDGCPQITGYIMSEARAKLWRTSAHIGMQNVWYMDTDSLLVNSDGHNAIQKAANSRDLDGLRSKGRYHKVQLYGPRSIILESRPSVAGMPKGSIQTGPKQWSGEVWRGAKESVRLNEPDSVSIRATDFHLRYNTNRRYFNSDGTTLAYRLPGYVPDGKVLVRPTRWQEAVNNGYPALLAHSKATQHLARPEQSKPGSNNPMRHMRQKVPSVRL